MSCPKILIIDDESKALTLLKVNLEEYGFDVLTAADGAGGMVLALKENPDAILLDIRLPDLSGWEVCKMLKSITPTRQIPVVFHTAYSSESDMVRARELGAAGYLTKPVDPEKMQQVLREVVEHRGISPVPAEHSIVGAR
jgi:DNA-binding response OmpR family regulator